jgi:hypothetical protein
MMIEWQLAWVLFRAGRVDNRNDLLTNTYICVQHAVSWVQEKKKEFNETVLVDGKLQ